MMLDQHASFVADVLGSECGRHVKAADILYEWLSSKQQSACHVMLDLWRQEEVGKGISSPATSPRYAQLKGCSTPAMSTSCGILLYRPRWLHGMWNLTCKSQIALSEGHVIANTLSKGSACCLPSTSHTLLTSTVFV
jgi:hypothetical protein